MLEEEERLSGGRCAERRKGEPRKAQPITPFTSPRPDKSLTE